MYNLEYKKNGEWFDIHGYKVRGIKKILSCININDFKNILHQHYGFDLETLNSSPYEDIVYNKCRVAVMYILGAIGRKNKDLLCTVGVAVGHVNSNWHCWLSTYDYYIDLTLKQFNDSVPELVIIKRNKAEKECILKAEKIYNYREWFKMEEEDSF